VAQEHDTCLRLFPFGRTPYSMLTFQNTCARDSSARLLASEPRLDGRYVSVQLPVASPYGCYRYIPSGQDACPHLPRLTFHATTRSSAALLGLRTPPRGYWFRLARLAWGGRGVPFPTTRTSHYTYIAKNVISSRESRSAVVTIVRWAFVRALLPAAAQHLVPSRAITPNDRSPFGTLPSRTPSHYTATRLFWDLMAPVDPCRTGFCRAPWFAYLHPRITLQPFATWDSPYLPLTDPLPLPLYCLLTVYFICRRVIPPLPLLPPAHSPTACTLRSLGMIDHLRARRWASTNDTGLVVRLP